MDEATKKQYLTIVLQALSEGATAEQIIPALQEKGLSPEEAQGLVEMAMQELQQGGGAPAEGGQPQGGQEGQPQEQSPEESITADEAMEVIGNIDIDADDLIDIVRTLLAMSPKEIDKMMEAIVQKANEYDEQQSQGGQPAEGAPQPGPEQPY